MTGLDRFQVRELNELLPPGNCITCGGISGRQFVDFGKTEDWYGAVYICNFCMVEAAGILGYADPVRVASLEHVNEVMEQANTELEEENQRLRNAVSAINSLRNIFPSNSNNGDWNGDSHYEGIEDELPSKSPEPKRNNSRLKRAKPGSIESSDEQGSTDVLNDDSLKSIVESI